MSCNWLQACPFGWLIWVRVSSPERSLQGANAAAASSKRPPPPQLRTKCPITHKRAAAQAKANRGILYVDEVNLLDDGLVDVVLDSAASGVNTVEREGISIAHPARFIMIGSGNPSEVPCSPVTHPESVLPGKLQAWL